MKSKGKPVKKASVDKLLEGALALHVQDSVARQHRAQYHFDAQDSETKEAVEQITEMLRVIGRKKMWVNIGSSKVVIDIPKEAFENNTFYMATEVVKDLALLDTRVASYAFPTDQCATCGIVIKPTKKGKK